MTDQRLDQLSGAVYNWIFSLLDGEPDLTGDEAGRIATKAEMAFRNAVTSDQPMTCPECGEEVSEPGECPDCEFDDGQPTEQDEWESFDPDC